VLPHHCVLHDVTATHSQTKKKCDDNTDVVCTDAGLNPSPPGRRCCDLTPPVRIIRRGTRHDESASGPPQLHLSTEGRQWGKQAREPSEKPAIFFPLVHTGVAAQFGRKRMIARTRQRAPPRDYWHRKGERPRSSLTNTGIISGEYPTIIGELFGG